MQRESFQGGRSAPAMVSLPLKVVINHRPAGPRRELVDHYALRLAELLDAQICPAPPEFLDVSPSVLENSSLLIYEEPVQSRLKRWVSGPPAGGVVDCCPVSVLVVRQPRWPLNRILLVSRGRISDYSAATWLPPLAGPVQAQVTVLAVQPDLSTTNSRAFSGDGLETWLASDTPLGYQLRHVVNALGADAAGIDLQFRGGPPEDQVRRVIAHTQPDLVVIAAEPGDWLERRILGDLVTSLLQWVDRPVLVAKTNFCSR